MSRSLVESVFCGDSILIIAKFLEPKDIVTICRMFKKIRYNLYGIYLQSVIRTIDSWFRGYYGVNYDQFREAMVVDKAIVTGSFILQMILGEKWKDSDIDMFISVQDLYLWDRSYCTEVEKFILNVPTISEFDKIRMFNDTSFHYVDSFGEEGGNIAQIRNYSIDGTKDSNFCKFQMIEVLKTKNIIRFIRETFDFDVCKNTFYYDEDGMHLDISNINDILNRRIIFRSYYNMKASIDRCKKYAARGFKFTDALDPPTNTRHFEIKDTFNKLLPVLACGSGPIYCKSITVK